MLLPAALYATAPVSAPPALPAIERQHALPRTGAFAGTGLCTRAPALVDLASSTGCSPLLSSFRYDGGIPYHGAVMGTLTIPSDTMLAAKATEMGGYATLARAHPSLMPVGIVQQAPPLVPAVAYQPKEGEPLGETLRKAGKKALGGGIAGAAAMGIQVGSLMWLRTTINYQYRYGGTIKNAFKTLYADGGVRRFYRGVAPALIQGPMSRFGDTASNAGMLALLDSYASTQGLPIGVKTMMASAAAGGWRIFLMPVDALKTTLQVEGKDGVKVLASKVRASGPTVLYHGALAAAAATWAGSFPWFWVYNELNSALPQYDELPKRLLRSAGIGFCASFVSDCVSNSIRVVKTTKQTSKVAMSYPDTVRMIVKEDGISGLMFRGLKTKIIANGLQGLMFSVLWRLGQDFLEKHNVLG